MGDGGTEPLNVTIFERHVLETDKLGPEPETALLGLFGEIGSLVSALKKSRRDTDGYFGYRAAVVEEIGDVLWYAAAVARRGCISLAEAAARVAATAELGLDEVRLGDIGPPELAGGGEAAFERALLELAGEAGELAKRFTGGDHGDNPDALRGDLIKLLRPLGRASVACSLISVPQPSAGCIAVEQWSNQAAPPKKSTFFQRVRERVVPSCIAPMPRRNFAL